MDVAAVGLVAAMGEARLDSPVRQQRRSIRPALDDRAGDALLLAGARGIDHHGLVALFD
jgi:hypothetical protein